MYPAGKAWRPNGYGALDILQDQLKPCQNDYMKLQAGSIEDEGKLAQVRYQQCDPQRCAISMNGNEGVLYQTRSNEHVYFTLIIKDESGSRVTEGGHKVRIHVQLMTFRFQVCPGKGKALGPLGNHLGSTWQALGVKDIGDGSYTFSYCPTQPGDNSLSVMVEDQPINESPFKWQVNQAKV
ncbi:Tripartite motif-containing protein 45 [Stylophora pistillata]|uniref:Tripartite motif-containing protein 45 n=1 Tax=Stylophora pistillata TaxID=50429 RepID=A0A2B4RP87_STYPI|nr:Tripartite motif-containing protein 45 [Stylophora pistillata]